MPTVLPCPRNDALERFLLGQVADEEASGIEHHLDECDQCRAALCAIEVDDPVVAAAQSARTESMDGLPDELDRTRGENLERLIERLSSLGGTGGNTTAALGLVSTPAETESTQEIYEFLAPPEAPGEIGRLGPYRVLKLLGAGGMGVVFQAEDTNLHRMVAIKAIRPTLAASASARRRFVREARAIAGLEHENIVKILHVGEDRGVPFLAMPFLPGETLEDRLAREGRLPIATVLEIGRQIAAGLAAAHDRGLVHRDVKPSNIWLERSRHAPRDESGRPNDVDPSENAASVNDVRSQVRSPHAEREGYIVKLLDFGLVRAVGGEEQVTHSSVIVGTPAYMAPEQAEGEAVDPRTDLFSLGCVLYRMCTGRAPFAEATTLKTLLALAKGRTRPPRDVNPAVPPALEDLVMKLLSRRAADRFASAREVATELQAIADGRVHSRRRRIKWIGALAGLTLMVVAAWFAGKWIFGSDSSRRFPLAEREGYDPSAAAAVFAPAVNYSAGLYPNQAVAADFNGDGQLDVAVANQQSHTVSVLLGAGDGTFGAPTPSAAGQWFAWSLTPGDLNGDGKLDLVVVNRGSHQISVLHGNDDGTFQPPVQYGVGRGPATAVIGDWNRDGKPDLAVNHADGISILIGEGDGKFQPARNIAAEMPVFDLAAADVNGDGKLDLLGPVLEQELLAVLLGNGDGSFGPPTVVNTGTTAQALLVADLDEDGNPDVVLGRTAKSRVLMGRGDGTFRDGLPLGGVVDHEVGWAAHADVDGDGHLDLGVFEKSGRYRVYFGNGDGSFREGPDHAAGAEPRRMAVGDFNGDGLPDVAVPNFHSNDLSILLNRGTASYRSMLGPAVHYPVGREPSGVATCDFNSDGWPDLAVTNAGDDSVSIFVGDRNNGFQPESTLSTGKRPSAVAAGDLNRDGKPDLVVAARGEDAAYVLLGTGDGANFDSGDSFATEKGPTSLALGDINRDGHLDAAVANYDSGSVSILLGNGDGTFRPAEHIPAGSRPCFVIAADWNRDGRLDLAVANYAQVGAVQVLFGNGDGTFRDAVALAAGAFPRSLEAADFNRDGKLDLAAANWGLGDVTLFLGRGDGSFRNPANHTFGFQGFAVAASDFDGDGRLDLAATDWGNHGVSVLRSIADDQFRYGGMFGVGMRPVAVVAGRFNRDARPDVVVVNSASDTISLLINRAAVPYLIAAPATDGLAGLPLRFSVHSYDANSSPVQQPAHLLRFSSSDPLAELPDERWAATASDNQRHEFFVTLRTPGAQTVTVETADGSFLAATAMTQVLEIGELHFSLEAPTSATAGTPFSISVIAMTPGERPVANYAGTIRCTSSDPAAKLPPDFRFANDTGHHTFTNEFVLSTPGEQTITITDAAHPSLSASVKITVK